LKGIGISIKSSKYKDVIASKRLHARWH